MNINITDNIICEADKKFELFIDNISDAHCFVFTDFERKYASVTIEDDDCGKLFYQSSLYYQVSTYIRIYVQKLCAYVCTC